MLRLLTLQALPKGSRSAVFKNKCQPTVGFSCGCLQIATAALRIYTREAATQSRIGTIRGHVRVSADGALHSRCPGEPRRQERRRTAG